MWSIEVTRYPRAKSRYCPRLSTERAGEALFYWHCLNIHSGYRARLRRAGRVIARKVSL